ncbi:acyl-ACP desaturase [Mycolicibacterium fallax]|uniref:Acyl-ACP desaturase n=1 Tax=Mycolicibacterium fallax TaxID=1793 RepID=A0A1X1REI3_MYCFA|nr:acyl-ACP desaturase [Mycolicibacterium fallax]ORV04063.1 acyl-ACP desaturase [Mycolicibacterium fallax]BBZ00316.1 acyl-ACP desaturase [Mycolicibacterium fallax]HOW93358.1 acyl-ACP desaturase [Mycolicibacterium fallax]HSA40932.1 acyl-ACP desaturase [Mycobacterium sp.]
MAVFPEPNTLTLELEPVVAENMQRHLGTEEIWFAHDYVPFDEGRNFAMLDGVDWEPSQQTLPQHVVDALEILLIDKDNMHGVHRELVEHFILRDQWGRFIGRWTAEEHLHAIVLRNYLMVTRNCDANANEDVRIDHVMNTGYRADQYSQVETLVFMTFYERSRARFCRNLAAQIDEPTLKSLIERIAADEDRHELFFANLVTHLLGTAREETVAAIAARARELEVVGADIKAYGDKRDNVAAAGIFNAEILRQIIAERIEAWGLAEEPALKEFI